MPGPLKISESLLRASGPNRPEDNVEEVQATAPNSVGTTIDRLIVDSIHP